MSCPCPKCNGGYPPEWDNERPANCMWCKHRTDCEESTEELGKEADEIGEKNWYKIAEECFDSKADECGEYEEDPDYEDPEPDFDDIGD